MSGQAVLSNIKTKEVTEIPINQITPNPYQPRKFFNSTSIEDLAKSIIEYGVIQPVTVRLLNYNHYELITGERRLRASKLAGLETIPAIVININDRDSAAIAIIENLQRQDLNYIEEAEGFKSLMRDYSFTQDMLAEKMGKSQSYIANKIRLLKLSKSIQKTAIENGLTERHARAILRLENEADREMVVWKIIQHDFTVKKTESYIENMLTEKEEIGIAVRQKIKRYIKDIRLLSNTIKHAVNDMRASGVNVEYTIEENENACDMVVRVEF
jgi:ParB family chromosome partitioning protein